jgi:hypothetical protein
VDPDPDDRYLKTLSPARQKAWRKAWIGNNGCYGIAEIQLFGSRHAANLEQQIPVLIYTAHHRLKPMTASQREPVGLSTRDR